MKQIFGTARFIASAGKFTELPPPQGDEFALVGRSNVGKSSFINHVCADHALARTSQRPGTTVCANLYWINESTYWVDLPGYGYAESRHGEKERWSHLSSDYCERRENLRGIIWLIDIRHIGTPIDTEAYAWLRSLRKPVLPLLTKADKLARNAQQKQCAELKRTFAAVGEPVLFNTLEHAARERFWERFEGWRPLIKT
jgi:GTP-binding protein